MLDVAVYIGRFQPFHKGHLSVVVAALKEAKHLIIAIGGKGEPRSLRSPFTFEERRDTILSILSEYPNISVIGLEDHTYNNTKWVEATQKAVNKQITSSVGWTDRSKKIGVMVNAYDNSEEYSDLFPQWVNVPIKETLSVRASSVREMFLWGEQTTTYDSVLPRQSFRLVENFTYSKEYKELLEEASYVHSYMSVYGGIPYPPIFQTVDAVVVQSGHILLVTRKGPLGKGKLALPGGYLEGNDTLEKGMIKELKEETRINLPEAVILGSVKKVRTFDSPYRSQLARMITTAYYIELNPMPKLPRVLGDDDAEKAQWYPLSELKRGNMHDDHFHIIQKLIA